MLFYKQFPMQLEWKPDNFLICFARCINKDVIITIFLLCSNYVFSNKIAEIFSTFHWIALWNFCMCALKENSFSYSNVENGKQGGVLRCLLVISFFWIYFRFIWSIPFTLKIFKHLPLPTSTIPCFSIKKQTPYSISHKAALKYLNNSTCSSWPGLWKINELSNNICVENSRNYPKKMHL